MFTPDDYRTAAANLNPATGPKILAMLTHAATAFELLEWYTNLAHGVGRAGGPPETDEFQSCIDEARTFLEAPTL